MGSMYVAVLFIGVTNGGAVQPVVSVERFVSYRERAAGMYSALPFALAQGLVGFCLAIQPTAEDMGTIGQNFMTGYQMVFDRKIINWGGHVPAEEESASTHDLLHNMPSFLVQQGFLADRNMPVIGQQPNVHHTKNSFQVKAETFPETSYHNTLLPGHFDQEDLMSALLKHQQEGSGGVQTDFGFDGPTIKK